MIIKKKYLQKEELNDIEQSTDELIDNADIEDIATDIEEENNISEEELHKNEDIDDLDLAVENIKFEPREERREGTRRRGYRRTQDRNLLSRAQQEALSIKEAAKQEGYEEGLNSSKSDLENLKNKIIEFFDYKNEVFDRVSECIYDIALEIAKKIIKNEIETNKEAVIPIIKEVISEINKTENKITLKVMPKDVELVKDKVGDIFSSNHIEAKITVIPDNNIKDGGVILETSNGIVDATIETQMAIIEKALKTGKES